MTYGGQNLFWEWIEVIAGSHVHRLST